MEKPQEFNQNSLYWCWVASAKKIGFQYNSMKSHIDPTERLLSFCSEFGLENQDCITGVKVPYSDKLLLANTGCRSGCHTVDAWQYIIAQKCVNNPGNIYYYGNDTQKALALKTVTSQSNSIVSLGHWLGNPDTNMVMMDSLNNELKKGNYILANISLLNGNQHSIVLMPSGNGTIRIFDPWDGYEECYHPYQLFRDGFLTSLGIGIVKWAMYIEL